MRRLEQSFFIGRFLLNVNGLLEVMPFAAEEA
jgi:hypothetical protein